MLSTKKEKDNMVNFLIDSCLVYELPTGQKTWFRVYYGGSIVCAS